MRHILEVKAVAVPTTANRMFCYAKLYMLLDPGYSISRMMPFGKHI